ncbi:LytR/AlgR family response regulator transcription factor [Echinicola salinicaeni]|uniref:LytR/AlgR family response regulator transcription factor n=1 Tax=Echinicola salinicaeni TaxID=2762757 RepID=UPI0016463AA4|nr:LytTR family DNA-binding domain-containing protein [Echinicola salinicaeni]
MNSLVIEDKAYIRKGLINLLNSVSPEINIIGECESVKEAVVVTNACKPDLVFLDINLSDGSGFDFLDQTEHLDFKVIFITAYEEFALKALKIGAVDYLMKPVDPEELQIALKKVQSKSSVQQKEQINRTKKVWYQDDSTLVLSLSDSFQVIDLSELLYCESDKGYTTFHLTDGKKFIASKPIKTYEEQLEKVHFTRPHQSFMVNLKFIDKYDKSGTIFLKNGKQIPVSFRKKEAFLTTFLAFNRH